jgi:hypothetical protein
VLLGAAGLTGWVATGCGRSGEADRRTGRVELEPVRGGVLLAGFVVERGYLVTGTPQRLPFFVGAPDGRPTTAAPAELTFRISREGEPVGDPVVVARRADGVPLPFFPLPATFSRPGVHLARTELDGTPAEQAFEVSPPSEVALLQPGTVLPAVDTPTTADPRGPGPVCTRTPPCPLHEVTLAEALGEGRPIALLVGSPRFCPSGLCGPVLDLLLEQTSSFPRVRFLHAEVYRDDTVASDPTGAPTSPLVEALGLSFEPSLFLADGRGTVVGRLDNVFDRTELRAALDGLP